MRVGNAKEEGEVPHCCAADDDAAYLLLILTARGHLDVHVDFNYIEDRKLFRRMNILVYFNKDWQDEWGGNIELWDEDVRDFYRETLEAIKVDGFDHSEVIDTKITMLNPTCALVDMTFNRWNKKGEIIPPSGRSVTYLLLERSGRWGISTLIVPGTDQVIPRSATG